MNPDLSYVSVVEPVSPAVERVKTVLFRPFDLGKWCVIGFSAWLAQLGSGGGGGNSGGGGRAGGRYRGDVPGEIREGYYEAKDFVLSNLEWLIPLAAVVFLIVVAVWLLLLWLSSRGRFSFLYCVAQNKGEFWNPWRTYRRHGSSLFAFRVVLGILAFLIVGIFLAMTGALVALSINTFGFGPYTILGIVMSGFLLVASAIVFAVIGVFTTDFAVPIMYLRDITCRQAWGVLVGMIAANMGRFVLYVLFKIVLGLVIVMLIVATVCLTCCIAGCIYIIPYVGSVVLLPLSVFGRSYSLYYLAQYGPDFNVFPPEPAPEAVPPAAGMQI